LSEKELFEKISATLVDGDDLGVRPLVQEALAKGIPAIDIIMKGCMPGMIKAGEMFASGLGGASMTDLIMAGEAMRAVLEVVRPHLKAEKAEFVGKFLIGQVEGDIHNIGRDIVTAMLRGVGWDVTDLGEDIPPAQFIDKAKEIQADIIGGACSITGSLDKLATMRELIDKEKLQCGYLIGGWSTGPEYAKKIGAAFARDALEAIKVSQELLKKVREKKN